MPNSEGPAGAILVIEPLPGRRGALMVVADAILAAIACGPLLPVFAEKAGRCRGLESPWRHPGRERSPVAGLAVAALRDVEPIAHGLDPGQNRV